ncbi:MAG: amidase [Chloroflexi bacterium]|nr:amidase [Chloroflexota bacterium]
MNFNSLNLNSLISNLRSGELDLLDYIDQLETRFNTREPSVLAFVPEDGRFQRLRQQAQQLLKKYPDSTTRPPLFGLPIGVKDIFHVDSFITQAGSALPTEELQGTESVAVTKMRGAGALIMGKTVTTEFAYFAPGPTRNPHNPTHTPGGSSSGSAAAVAAGLCPFAFGTQTIGSINRPAAFCGTVGYKPSYGRISAHGVIPLSESLDHIGFFTLDAAGVGVIAEWLCEGWRGVPPTEQKPTLGIPEGPYLERATAVGLAQFHADCDHLADAGFTLKTVPAMPDFAEIRRRHLILMAAETARFHAAWFAQYEALYHPKTVDLIRAGQAYGNDDIAAAQRYKLQTRQQVTALMDEHGLDSWISPSATGPAPKGLDSTGDPIMNLPWTNAGLPTLTIPTGADEDGLPMGLQFIGRWQADERLVAFGKMIEENFDTNNTNFTNLERPNS